MSLPLSGLLVVALEQAVAAPMCTCRLADAGARVIKIERPEGDFARGYDKLARPPGLTAESNGESAYFVWLNRGKESLVLDLARDEDQALLAAHPRQGRRVRAEPQARRDSQARLPARGTAPRPSAAGDLLDLRLRRGRPLPRAQGLRHADPGRERARLAHRLARGAGARRRLRLRHRRRHERLRGDPRGADRARAHRRRRRDLDLHVRRHGRLDGGAAAAVRGRPAAAAHGPRAHLDRALRRVQDRATAPTFSSPSRATANGACWPRRCSATPRSPPIPPLPPTSRA